MTLKVTASFGVSTLSQQDVTALQMSYMDALDKEILNTAKSNKMTEMVIHKLIEVADTALYEAKDNGRNQVASADQLVLSNKIAQPSFGLQ
jgi:GGDEF domain-containing protein